MNSNSWRHTLTDLITPGAGILFMKVGTHAQETLADIIKRKSQEIKETGYGLWGYGGNTCHPTSMVQPFAKGFEAAGKPIHLCMESMLSKHFAEPLCAAEFSLDGIKWEKIPDSIEVRGSRFALKIGEIFEKDFKLPLNRTRVPVGPNAGRLGSRYISGRVDKACLEVLAAPEIVNRDEPVAERQINLVAELKAPYAVFLRNYR
ncbi:hypothetical protein EOS93_14610 [Rhizobium sp. RMa-01]|nr:hypothetical protein BBJ66_18075 [Rhizobium sp. RSm-3]RVU10662.1 hypothetical protein EOS93_14610 [Rhizobium sp. RMa-01]